LRLYYNYFASQIQKSNTTLFYNDIIKGIEPKIIPHPYLCYVLNPDYIDPLGKTNHNKLGFRGKDVKINKGDKYRIVTLGASTTYTTKVQVDSLTYPSRLERILNDSIPNLDIEVINAGVGGYTTWETLLSFQLKVLELNPDMIIVYHAINDLHTRRAPEYNRENTGYRRYWNEKLPFKQKLLKHSLFVRQIALWTNSVKPAGVEHYTVHNQLFNTKPDTSLLRINPPCYFEQNLNLISQIAKTNNIKTVFCSFVTNPTVKGHYSQWDYYKSGILEMNAVIKKVAEQRDDMMIDLNKTIPLDKNLWADGVHLNEKGAQLKAKQIANNLIPIIKNEK
jgi:lysophospholipase L1-like esterase